MEDSMHTAGWQHLLVKKLLNSLRRVWRFCFYPPINSLPYSYSLQYNSGKFWFFNGENTNKVLNFYIKKHKPGVTCNSKSDIETVQLGDTICCLKYVNIGVLEKFLVWHLFLKFNIAVGQLYSTPKSTEKKPFFVFVDVFYENLSFWTFFHYSFVWNISSLLSIKFSLFQLAYNWDFSNR